MNYLTRQFAEQQAESDFREFCRRKGHTHFTIPVDPADVAEVLWGTSVLFLNENELDGEVIAFADLNSNQIVVELCGYEPRERFSLAHEAGHISLHRYLLDLGELKSTEEKYYEYQADAYASALLMPKFAVHKVIETNSGLLDDDSYRINLISEKFQVSIPAARIRLENLNLIANPNIHRSLNVYEREVEVKRDDWFLQQ